MVDLNRFVKERDAALLSLNEAQILRYMRKYDIMFDYSNETVFWAAVHKAILQIASAAPEQRAASADWLIHHGFQTGGNYA